VAVKVIGPKGIRQGLVLAAKRPVLPALSSVMILEM